MSALLSIDELTNDDIERIEAVIVTVDGKHRRWRRNGATKRWKRSPERFRIPLKHGMFAYDALEANSIQDLRCQLTYPTQFEVSR